ERPALVESAELLQEMEVVRVGLDEGRRLLVDLVVEAQHAVEVSGLVLGAAQVELGEPELPARSVRLGADLLLGELLGLVEAVRPGEQQHEAETDDLVSRL